MADDVSSDFLTDISVFKQGARNHCVAVCENVHFYRSEVERRLIVALLSDTDCRLKGGFGRRLAGGISF